MKSKNSTNDAIRTLAVLAIVASLIAAGWYSYQGYKGLQTIDQLNIQLQQALAQRQTLERRLNYWINTLTETPKTELKPIEITAPMILAQLQDAATARGLGLSSVRLAGGNANATNGLDLRMGMAKKQNTDAEIMVVEAEFRLLWKSLRSLREWIESIYRMPAIVEKVDLSEETAIIKVKILGV